ncbi:uncharacterized protein LOC105700321 isoform X2 [Orussus abietinus]|uniref:uncharacterized protein LOC105700321 isoform X2 n=1 Tax=Orussus abietinus TaxID=222816 RepID=UPI0006250BE4|nr:uncharacterized protein LOC105700321 isoform X2 [Orussus abietinus]
MQTVNGRASNGGTTQRFNDPEIRKKWQDALAGENHMVTDGTYICSKHFHQSDIITHWVSGVPPHVVTIKYKKCRLKPDAVPELNLIPKTNILDKEEDYVQFKVNKNTFPPGKIQAKACIRERHEAETFLIPREDFSQEAVESYKSNDIPVNNGECKNSRETENRFDTNLYRNDVMVLDNASDEFIDTLDTHLSESVQNSDDGSKVHNDYTISKDRIKDEFTYVGSGENALSENQDPVTMETTIINEPVAHAIETPMILEEPVKTSETQDVNMINKSLYKEYQDLDSNSHFKVTMTNRDEILYVKDFTASNDNKSNEALLDDEIMLFEDFLEVYTEVVLPQGWSCMVASKKHATTVMYIFLGMLGNGMPCIEKQVFVKSDMLMRCGAGNIEIDPVIYDLTSDNMGTKVRSLSDLEEFIEEFHQRTLCSGISNKKMPKQFDSSLAYREGDKWRHIGCPFILNNETAVCSKCKSLKNSRSCNRSKKLMYLLEASNPTKVQGLQKTVRHDPGFQIPNKDFKDKFRSSYTVSKKQILGAIKSMKLPEIQKLMIKECLRATHDGKNDTKNTQYSESWVFLCLLLYIESPGMYRYMMLNNFMTLPPKRIIQRYLQRIKSEPQFRTLFRRTIESFLLIENEDVKEITDTTGR